MALHSRYIIIGAVLLLALAHSGWAQPIIAPGKTARHNLQIDTRGNHLSGMMLARPTSDGPRVLASSYFGLTIFDFTLAADSLKVNSCIEPMRRPKVQQLLERDLRVLLIDRNRAKLKKRTAETESRKLGSGFGKSVFVVSYNADGNIEKVVVKHPWVRLQMTIEEIK